MLWGFTEKSHFQWVGFPKNQYIGGNCLKMGGGGGLGQFADLRWGAWQKRGRWCFWEGVDNPMHTMFQHWNILDRRHSFNTYTKFSEKLSFYPLIRTRKYAYQRVRNVSFVENAANVLNEWPHMWDSKWYPNDLLGYITIRYNNIDDVIY